MRTRSIVAGVVAAAVLAACTSTGTAYNPPFGGNIVTVVISGSATVAYQTSPHSPWKLLAPGQTTFETTNGTAYGVAYTCPDILPLQRGTGVRPQRVGWQPTAVIQSTTQEFNTVPIPCSLPQYATLSGTYDATAIANTVGVDVDDQATPTNATSGSYSMTVPVATQDVLSFAYDVNLNVLAVKTYPNVDVTASGATQNIVYSAGDAVGANKTVSWTNNPPWTGETQGYTVSFGDLWHQLSLANAPYPTPTVTYPTIAAGDVSANDFYTADGTAYIFGSGSTNLVEAMQYGASLPSSMEMPDVWNANGPDVTSQPQYTLDFNGLHAPRGGVSGYLISQPWYSGNGQDGWNLAFVSDGFLKARRSSTYTFPNITLAGFSSMTVPTGDTISWQLSAVDFSGVFLGELVYVAVVLDQRHGAGAQSVNAHHMPAPLSAMYPLSKGSTNSTSGMGYISAASGCTTEGTGAACGQ